MSRFTQVFLQKWRTWKHVTAWGCVCWCGTHTYVQHDMHTHMTAHAHMCDMTHTHTHVTGHTHTRDSIPEGWHDLWAFCVCDTSVTRNTHMRDMVWHETRTCATSHTHMCTMMHSHMWHDTHIRVTVPHKDGESSQLFVVKCDTTYLRQDTYICTTWHTRNMTHMWHDTHIRMTTRHICEMTHTYTSQYLSRVAKALSFSSSTIISPSTPWIGINYFSQDSGL